MKIFYNSTPIHYNKAMCNEFSARYSMKYFALSFLTIQQRLKIMAFELQKKRIRYTYAFSTEAAGQPLAQKAKFCPISPTPDWSTAERSRRERERRRE